MHYLQPFEHLFSRLSGIESKFYVVVNIIRMVASFGVAIGCK